MYDGLQVVKRPNPGKAMIKYLLIGVGATLAVFLGLMFTGDTESSNEPTRIVSTVEAPTVFAVGRVEGATPEIQLHPQAAGPVTQVLVEEGRLVDRGQLLLQIDDRRQRHAVALAAAELSLAQAQRQRLENGARPEERAEAEALYRAKAAELAQARLTWQRTQPLRQAEAVSQQEADNQRSRVDSLTAEVGAALARLQLLQAPARADDVLIAQARVDAAQARLELAEFELEQTRLRSPVRGQILKINAEVGELAGPTSNEPAIIVAGTGKIHVRAFVEEMDAPRIRKGMLAEIVADGLPDQTFQGRVVRLSPRMGRKNMWSNTPAERLDTKTREVWIELDEVKDVVIGLRVDVRIDVRAPRLARLPQPSPVENTSSLDALSPYFNQVQTGGSREPSGTRTGETSQTRPRSARATHVQRDRDATERRTGPSDRTPRRCADRPQATRLVRLPKPSPVEDTTSLDAFSAKKLQSRAVSPEPSGT